jgi:hypothetical protein
VTAPSEPGAELPAEDIDAAQATATTATVDAATADAGAQRPRRKRHVLVIVLIVVTSLLAFVTALGTWVRRQALDTDAWVSASNEVLADPVVRDALSTYVVNELYANVDVAGQFQERLPDDLKGLAGPLAGALREPATVAVDRLLATSQFRSLWEQVNRRAHETLVRVLEDKTRAGLSTAEGTVTLDLSELMREVGQQLGLPSGVLDRISADAGHLTLVSSDALANAQKAVRVLKVASVAFFLLVIALYALAVYLADGWRRVAVRDIGIAVVLVGLALAVVQRMVGNYISDSIVEVPANRPAVDAIWLIGTKLLRDIARNLVATGILVFLFALFAGPLRSARWLRAHIAPLFRSRPGLVWGGAGAIFLLLVLWGPLPILRTWYGFIAGAVILGAAVEALRRQCVRELDEGTLPVVTRPDLGGITRRFSRHDSTSAAPDGGVGSTGPPRGTGTGTGSAGTAAELERLQVLHASGGLTDAEFAAAKANLLGSSPSPAATATAEQPS